MNKPNGMSDVLYQNICETYLDFLVLSPRWKQVKDDAVLRKKFCTRNRNPLFDLTKSSFFDTSLCSERSLKSDNKVKDHYFQRSKAVGLIFDEIEKNPGFSIKNFIDILKYYCSVVTLDSYEHRKVTSFCKSNPQFFNYEVYEKCGIKIEGLKEFIKK